MIFKKGVNQYYNISLSLSLFLSMKKLLLTIALVFVTYISFCQNFGNNDNPLTIGILGGSSIATLKATSPNSDLINPGAESPFSVGFNIDYKFNDYFSIKPGIFYAGKGGTFNPGYIDPAGNNVSVYDDYKLHYLEIPIDFVGHIPLGDGGANIFLGGGPYYAYGLNGTNRQTDGFGDATTQKIKFGNNGDFKSSDFGVTSIVGFQAGAGWSVAANLDFGLTNIMQNNTTGFDATKITTATFYFSVGYRFN